ncbi:hypothetical protein M409DRAFT_20077 [Zasmidium cellare ATCC 36951]|uniref:Uncharacterized protein n=1 Tax=Zasmidium cellare ATCC 36951 TaxID=1080233 RepID=A0A6A6CV14_ZASCE|nr:uncharacterized protein M409DRAFT_20077 [Zasmidium cellare ATCC 36951]KAF2169662.1 hypothetical protein M409DRAFT_20077 [Zasmidium cellare ATCC 36951]
MNQKLKDTSFYSPVLDQLEIPLIETKSFGAFFEDVDNPSLFRQPPSPEVDAAWDDLEWIGRFYVTDEEVVKLGKDPSITVKSPRHPGKNIAIVTVFHELHCLNSLRKALYPEYYFGTPRTDEIYWSHIYHCIDAIRQSLMCNADVDVTTCHWVETQEAPYADLSKNQVCRDFDAIKSWQNETMEDLNDVPVHKQGGEVELPRPKKLKQIHEASENAGA